MRKVAVTVLQEDRVATVLRAVRAVTALPVAVGVAMARQVAPVVMVHRVGPAATVRPAIRRRARLPVAMVLRVRHTGEGTNHRRAGPGSGRRAIRKMPSSRRRLRPG